MLAGGVTLSGGMKIAHDTGFSQKMVQLTVGQGRGKPVCGRPGEAKGCTRLLGPGLLVH